MLRHIVFTQKCKTVKWYAKHTINKCYFKVLTFSGIYKTERLKTRASFRGGDGVYEPFKDL